MKKRAFFCSVAVAMSASPLAGAADGVPADCASRVAALTHALDDWARQFRDKESRAYANARCAEPNVVCLDRFGALHDDSLPPRVAAGQSLSVSVIVPVADRASLSLIVGVRASAVQSNDSTTASPSSVPPPSEACSLNVTERQSLRRAAWPIAHLASRAGFEGLDLPPDGTSDAYWSSDGGAIFSAWNAWLTAHRDHGADYTVLPATLDIQYGDLVASIDYLRTERGAGSPSATAHYDLIVDNGLYYLELAVLVPVVYHGKRQVTLGPSENATELRVGIENDWHVTGSLMVDFFPFGRQKGQLSSFQTCRSRSCLENWLGVQFGTSFDHPAKDWYAGLVLEPASGLAVGAGVAFLKGDFLGPGLAEGMLLPSQSTLTIDSHYMARPYIGIAVTTDIFHSLDRGSLSKHELR